MKHRRAALCERAHEVSAPHGAGEGEELLLEEVLATLLGALSVHPRARLLRARLKPSAEGGAVRIGGEELEERRAG